MAAAAAGAVLATAVTGCARGGEVVRVVDGRALQGDFVEPEAYAAFLRGVMAEERGELGAAAAAYREAAERDDRDPEIWARLGSVLCRANPRDDGAGRAFSRAQSLDRRYEGLWAARAACASARGDAAAGVVAAGEAAAADPMAVEPQAVLAQAEAARGAREAARDRLVALTLLHRDRATAWEALAGWARAHGDAGLEVEALGRVARLDPARHRALGGRAIALAGEGELAAARALAAVVVDAPRGAAPRPPEPLVGRLALDAAVHAGDAERVRARATRAHLGLDEAAGRALLAGDPAMAQALAQPLADADPAAAGARMVLAVAAPGSASPFRQARPAAAPIPASVLLPFAALVARSGTPEAARAVIALAPRDALDAALAGDALTLRLAVDLAARGVLDERLLPEDGRIELAARRREPPPEPGPAADARHRLLALVLLRPADAAAVDLGRRLAPAAARDALVAVALARQALARRAPVDRAVLGRLLGLDPTDPLAAAAALDVAQAQGDQGLLAPARARLTALARTPAERALIENQ